MSDELMDYKRRMEVRISDKPIWEKSCLTIEEAAEYSGIGRTKLRQLASQKKCPFIISNSNQIFIIREKFDDYIKKQKRI